MRIWAFVLLTGLGCADNQPDCVNIVSRDVTLDANQADASMALAIHDCLVDVDACDALCARVADGLPTYCDVHFTNAHVYVNTSWQEDNGTCDFAEPAGGKI
ncbi:MAG TPA: hypothetical protein VGM88_27090 [Kofleriaceae bacterium]|jgi:hypothetical protein